MKIKRYKKYRDIKDNMILFPNRSPNDFKVGQIIFLVPKGKTFRITKILSYQQSLFDDNDIGVYLEIIAEELK